MLYHDEEVGFVDLHDASLLKNNNPAKSSAAGRQSEANTPTSSPNPHTITHQQATKSPSNNPAMSGAATRKKLKANTLKSSRKHKTITQATKSPSNDPGKSGAAAAGKKLKANFPTSKPLVTEKSPVKLLVTPTKSPVKQNSSGSSAKALCYPSTMMTSSSPMKTKGSIVSVEWKHSINIY